MEQRWDNGNGYRNNKHFYDAILKYGKDNFQHIIIAENLSKEESCELEKKLIKQYDTTNREKGYNHSTGGDISALGVKRSKEYIERLVESHKGRKHSDETKRKISEKLKGNTCGLGRVVDENTRKKMSKPVLCVETGEVFYGIREAERQTGVNSRNIEACLHSRRTKAGGYHWRYAI